MFSTLLNRDEIGRLVPIAVVMLFCSVGNAA